MKTLILAASVALALSASAQDLYFTNRTVTFTDIHGTVFANAELMHTDLDRLIFRTNGNIGAVGFSNLSASALADIGIPNDYLRNIGTMKQKRQAAIDAPKIALREELLRLSDTSNLFTIKVNAIISRDYDANYGAVYRCEIRLPSGATAQMFVAKMPTGVSQYFSDRDLLDKQISQLTRQIDTGTAQIATVTANLKSAQYQVDRAFAAPPTPIYTGDPATDQVVDNTMAAIRNGNYLAEVDIDYARQGVEDAKGTISDWKDKLAVAQKKRDTLKKSETSAVTVRVLLSRFMHNRIQMIVCGSQTNQP